MKARIWFITGGSRGLGKSLAEAVLAAGDTVISTTRDGTTSWGKSDRLRVVALDVADRAAAAHAVKEAFRIRERLDVIVNNAGAGLIGSAEEASMEEIERVMAVNFFGPFAITQAALPLLRRQRSGHIVNITSIAGVAPSALAEQLALRSEHITVSTDFPST